MGDPITNILPTAIDSLLRILNNLLISMEAQDKRFDLLLKRVEALEKENKNEQKRVIDNAETKNK